MSLLMKVVERGATRATLLDLVAQIRRGADVHVGVINSEPHGDGLSNADLAAIHEFGTETVPERSFLRVTFREKRQDWIDFLGNRMKQSFKRNITPMQALDQLGLRMVADVKATIVAGIDPPNAPSTIAAKGSSKPLIDTGRLKESISHRVVVGDKAA